jgi:hypothetical protein
MGDPKSCANEQYLAVCLSDRFGEERCGPDARRAVEIRAFTA